MTSDPRRPFRPSSSSRRSKAAQFAEASAAIARVVELLHEEGEEARHRGAALDDFLDKSWQSDLIRGEGISSVKPEYEAWELDARTSPQNEFRPNSHGEADHEDLFAILDNLTAHRGVDYSDEVGSTLVTELKAIAQIFTASDYLRQYLTRSVLITSTWINDRTSSSHAQGV